ncbi:MAG: zinc finger protein [Raineya sp.]|nr:hypothetical protein [Raineya sp.]MDW8295988.1 zinc finger protein [Raineya sp.]
MSWLCISCETVNYEDSRECIVCGTERYYSLSEVKNLLENHPEIKPLQEQIKKLSQQNKWLQTRNKNLTQENKALKANLERLENQITEKIAGVSTQNKPLQENTLVGASQIEIEKENSNLNFPNHFVSVQEKIIWGEISALLSASWAIFWVTR